MSDAPQNLKLIGASASKPPLGIVPMHPLVGVARVFEDSSTKYAPFNYMVQSIDDALESYDSAELRHRLASTLLGGQVTPESYAALDPDSGLPHIFHRISGLLILASLMIRDGVIPEDPGMGKRKRAAFAERASTTPACGVCPVEPCFCADVQRVERHGEPEPIVLTLGDPDAERRAAAERNLEQLKRDQQKLADAKRRWEWRCTRCNGSGIVAGPGEYTTEPCDECKGTGLRTGAEGVRL